jgi:hypothetical protein
MHKQTPLSRHLEIETYTWDVLPDHLKTDDIVVCLPGARVGEGTLA